LDVYRDIPNSNNSGIFAKLNIPIGAGKAKRDAEKKALEEAEKNQ
jgi:hypothetical protein